LISCLPGVPVYEQAENKVRNPSFDDEIPISGEWTNSGGCSYGWDCEESYDGSCSAVITSTSYTGDCEWTTPWKSIKVLPGKYYDFSGWIKADFAPSGQEAHVAVNFWNSNGDLVSGYCPVAVSDDTNGDWVRVAGSVRAPSLPGDLYAKVYCRVRNAAGVFWFDDIFFGLATGLKIEKRGSPSTVSLGEQLTYTIIYTNVGRETANAVKVLENYDDYVINPTPAPTPSWGDYEWSVGTLDPGESGVIVIAAQVDGDIDEHCTLVNFAKIESRETEITISDVETTTVRDCPSGCDVSIVPQSPEKLAYPGEALYHHTVINTGNQTGTLTMEAVSLEGLDISIAPLTSTLEVGEEIETITVITLPSGSLSDTVYSAIVTATLASLTSADAAVDTSILSTIAKRAVGVDISPGEAITAPPTGSITFSHVVTNTGNWTDTIDMVCGFDPRDLRCKLPSPSLTLDPAAGQSVSIEISDISYGHHIFTVTASSRADDTGFRQVVDEVTKTCQLALPSVLREYCHYDRRNDSLEEAFGPLVRGAEYCCLYPEDCDDYFYFVTSGPGSISVDVTNYLACEGDLLLYRHREEAPNRPKLVDWWGSLHPVAEHMWLKVQHEQGMNPLYYVRVYTPEGSQTHIGRYCLSVQY
jgi:hypothetical protein